MRPQARFNDIMWVHVDEMVFYIHEVFQRLIDVRLDLPRAQQAAARQEMATRASLFVVGVSLCALLYYPSVIRALNKSIKGNRALLLLLPEDVVSSVKVRAMFPLHNC